MWTLAAACAVALGVVACGGGGGGGGSPAFTTPTQQADARNGNYQLYAADGQLYTLNLDFDAGAYRLAGGGLDTNGSFVNKNASQGMYAFDDATWAGALGSPRFQLLGQTLVGGIALPSGTVPFIASRSFLTTLADAAGTYHFFGRVVDMAGPEQSIVTHGELLASGTMRTCNDPAPFTIAACPLASISTSTLTVQGDEIIADPGGASQVSMRVVQIGNSKVLLASQAVTATAKALLVGVPDTGAFAAGAFEGHNTNGQWAVDFNVGPGAYSANWAGPGGNFIRPGTASAGPLAGLVTVDGGVGEGMFLAARTPDLLVMTSAPGNLSWPGYMEIGLRR
jgi:hypothetical protein